MKEVFESQFKLILKLHISPSCTNQGQLLWTLQIPDIFHCIRTLLRYAVLWIMFSKFNLCKSLGERFLYFRITQEPWLVWLSGLSSRLQSKGLPVRFPVRAHAWVASQVLSRGHVRGKHTLMFLSLCFSLLSPLSKNK